MGVDFVRDCESEEHSTAKSAGENEPFKKVWNDKDKRQEFMKGVQRIKSHLQKTSKLQT